MNRPSGSVSGKIHAMQVYGSIVTLPLTLGNGWGVDFGAASGAANVFQWDLAAAAAARCVHSFTWSSKKVCKE